MSTFLRIQAAALETFAGHGFEATGIRQIAERAGIPTSLLYHYSRSKVDLLCLLVEDGLERLQQAIDAALALALLPEEQLVAITAVHVFVHADNMEMARLLDGEMRVLGAGDRERVMTRRDAIDAAWRRILADGVAEEVFDPGDADATRLALIRMCNGVATWYSPGGRLPVQAVAREFADLALGAVRARRGGRGLRISNVERPDLAAVHAAVQQIHAGMPGGGAGTINGRSAVLAGPPATRRRQ